jgi:hypothetical protein
MSKMARMTHLGILKHKLWPKERPEVKLSMWLRTIKSQELPWFLCVQVLCYICWKAFDEGYNFALNLTLWASKVAGVPILGISKLPLGSPRTKWHLSVGPVARHKVYYKGEGGGFPQVRVVVSLVNPCLLVARPCTKNALILH